MDQLKLLAYPEHNCYTIFSEPAGQLSEMACAPYTDWEVVKYFQEQHPDKTIIYYTCLVTDTWQDVDPVDPIARANTLKELVPEISNSLVVFVVYQEGLPYPSVAYASKMQKQLDIPCVYLTGAYPSSWLHDVFIHERGDSKLGLCAINSWQYCTKENQDNIDQIDLSKPKQKDFVCFNGSNRWPRVLFVGLLSHYGLVQKGYLSYNHHKEFKNSSMYEAVEWFESMSDDWCKMFSDILPLVKKQYKEVLPNSMNLYDTEDWSNFTHDHISDRDKLMYESSHYSVVTETAYADNFYAENAGHFNIENVSSPCVYLSEKTYRHLAAGVPTIVVSRSGSLQALRQQGYNTFHPWIDESYDNILNDQERMIAIVKEMKRLSEFTDKQWAEWHQHVDPICEHNYNVTKDLEYTITQVVY